MFIFFGFVYMPLICGNVIIGENELSFKNNI